MYDEKSPQDSLALMEQGWVYLDVRTPEEFSGGHPEGAHNVPFALLGPGGMMPNPEFLMLVRMLYPTDTPLLVGCASTGRSARACQMLAQMGYGRLVLVDGGYSGSHDAWGNVVTEGWAGCGLPTAAGEVDGSYQKLRTRARGG